MYYFILSKYRLVVKGSVIYSTRVDYLQMAQVVPPRGTAGYTGRAGLHRGDKATRLRTNPELAAAPIPSINEISEFLSVNASPSYTT